jgi:hypothetical protein
MTTQPDMQVLTEEAKELMRQEVARLKQLTGEIRQELDTVLQEHPELVPQQDQTGVGEPTGSLPGQTGPTQSSGGGKITDAHLAAAKQVLGEIGGGDNIVVVPDRVILGVGNHAVTIKDDSKISFFRMGIDEDAYEGVDVAKLKESIGMDTILVHPGVLSDPDALRGGTIWHEHGHVLHGAAENGNVFAYELTCLRQRRNDDVAATFVKDHRKGGGYYTETAVNPGLDNLAQQMSDLGFTFQAGEKAQAQQRAAAPELELGKVLRGDPAKVKSQVGTQDELPDLSTVPKDGPFEWAGHRWTLLRRDVDYKITATKLANPHQSKDITYRGSYAQIKGQTRNALTPLPELEGKKAKDTFVWEKATWEVSEVKEALQVRVDESLG